MTLDYDPNLSPGWERRTMVIGIILIALHLPSDVGARRELPFASLLL